MIHHRPQIREIDTGKPGEIRYRVIAFNRGDRARNNREFRIARQHGIVLKRDSNNYRPPKNYLFTRTWGSRLIYKGNIRSGVLSNVPGAGEGERGEDVSRKEEGPR